MKLLNTGNIGVELYLVVDIFKLGLLKFSVQHSITWNSNKFS